ncbi:stress response protein NST1-like isoform X2 [Tripterygium wilfordii]|uniref:stress response protein NST1-like isoform X2 n=1 Tax=Tripterygium wilfordii TaxID=458696 RepID=UPI0018F7E842|nr:stress response protein NST1-like isoform X2 [Tripterygium wilfordii]
MDAYQQPHHHMRPPTPPPSADPHQYHHYQQQQPPPTVPPQGSWYSNQFHYHPSSHSPSTPPQWAPPPPPPPPPPHSDHHPPFSSSYPPPPHHPSYPAPLPSHSNQFPPPPHSRPHLPPQIPQSYPQVNQEWGNSNWGHHHAWDHPAAHNMEVDWAAKARAWASAKAATDDQHPHSQFTPIGRHEEQGRFHEHHPQAVNYPYQDIQQQSILPSNHQQFSVPSAHHRPPMVYMQETSSMNSGASSYPPNGHLPYTAKDGTSHAAFSHQDSFQTSSSVHQQEVPSSYSSVAGKEGIMEQKDQLYTSLASLPNSSAQEGQHLVQPSLPAIYRSVMTEQPFAYDNHTANLSTDLSDQPLDFAPGFNRDRDALMQPGYATHYDSAVILRGMDPVAVVPPINSWAPSVVSGAVYPSIPPVIPSGPQQDPSVSVSGNAIPPLGRFPGPSFQPTLSSAGAPFGLGPGPALNPSPVFPGDAYGSFSERPKKASVPNWLKEEIIKNASVITKSSLEHPKEDTQSIEDEGVDRSFGNGDQADSKSIDSSRSTEEEDEEDYKEAAKTAAINQEIKRVLTEVLLKVTDELLDEIATKVMDEDDLPVEVDQNTPSLNYKVSPPPAPADPIPRAPAKVVVPVEAQDSGTTVISEKPTSSSLGNVLGLANYDSDDDNDDDDDDDGDEEIQNSSEPNSIKNSLLARADNKHLPGYKHDPVENSSLLVDLEEHGTVGKDLQGGLSKSSSLEPRNNKKTGLSELAIDREYREYEHASQGMGDIDFGKAQDGYNSAGSNGILGQEGVKAENPGDNFHTKKSTVNDPHCRETRMRPDEYDRNENKESSYGKDSVKEVERSREVEKQGEHRKRRDEKQLRKEKTNDQNGSKERMKQREAKPGEGSEESESRKRSAHQYTKEDKKEEDRVRRTNPKEGNNKKRESTNSKEEGDARHNLSSVVSRHKRRRSSSISSRGRNSKENSVTHAHDSSDDESDDSKRKLHARRRDSSPSPVRSRRRQLSRSPHSKHSQRRHSPYSSLETNRGRRRSRSRSPMRRRR